MTLPELLRREREAILDRWIQRVVATYPDQTARFLSNESDRFRNPVGHSIRAGLSSLYDGLVEGRTNNEQALDEVLRVRAVQEFSPSQAVGFVFLLKRAVREVVEQAQTEESWEDLLGDLETRIDKLTLEAFDLYVRCRIQLYEIRARDLKRRTFQLSRLAERSASKSEESDRDAEGVETVRKGGVA